MTRIFVYDGREFPDPDPSLAVEEVRKQLSDFFPELTNADTREERRGDDEVRYTFARRIGTKGAGESNIVAILRGVPERQLAVFDLAVELIDADGEIDAQVAAGRQPEINLAIAEVDSYARATRSAVEALRRIPVR
jgi:PRTRC genetic system protein C